MVTAVSPLRSRFLPLSNQFTWVCGNGAYALVKMKMKKLIIGAVAVLAAVSVNAASIKWQSGVRISNLVMSNLKLHGEPGDAEILQLDIAWLHDVIERDATGFGRRVHEPRKTDQGKISPQMFQN